MWNSVLVSGILNPYKSKGFTHIMQGTARGVDRLAKQWAVENGLIPMDRPANWKLGKMAGPIRNIQMMDEAHLKSSGNCELVAIWDGVSNGTKQMFDQWVSKYPNSPYSLVNVGLKSSQPIELSYEQYAMDWGKRNI